MNIKDEVRIGIYLEEVRDNDVDYSTAKYEDQIPFTEPMKTTHRILYESIIDSSMFEKNNDTYYYLTPEVKDSIYP